MSEKKGKEEMRGGSAKAARNTPKRQVVWAILMLFSLVAMFAVGISAIRAARKGQDGMTPSYAASDVGDGVKDAKSGQDVGVGTSGTELAAAVQNGRPIGNSAGDGSDKTDGNAIGDSSKPDGSAMGDSSRPIGSAMDGSDKPDGNAMDGSTKPDGSAIGDSDKPDGSAIGDSNKPDGNAIDGSDKPDGSTISDSSKPDGNAISDSSKPVDDQDANISATQEEQGKAEENQDKEGDVADDTPDPDKDVPVIAMTFDDGPFTKVTNRIVDVLLEYDAGATFFVVGSRIDMYSDTLERVFESGFEVASHTWSHKNLNKLSQEEILKEINDTQEKLNTYIPVGKVLLRPPYGNANEQVRAIAGTSLINWTLDSEDWKSKDADKVIERVLSTVKDGDIILMHDLYESTAEAVEYLVPELVARGYRIVSVSELFRLKGITLEEGILYRNPWDCY